MSDWVRHGGRFSQERKARKRYRCDGYLRTHNIEPGETYVYAKSTPWDEFMPGWFVLRRHPECNE